VNGNWNSDPSSSLVGRDYAVAKDAEVGNGRWEFGSEIKEQGALAEGN
jgi:hypothetical protein